MDQGVLRCEPTRRASLAWAMRLVGHSHVYGRDSYGHGGAYGYTTGTDDPHDTRCYWFIERPDRARRGGFAGLDRPLYPYPDRPYDQDPEALPSWTPVTATAGGARPEPAGQARCPGASGGVQLVSGSHEVSGELPGLGGREVHLVSVVLAHLHRGPHGLGGLYGKRRCSGTGFHHCARTVTGPSLYPVAVRICPLCSVATSGSWKSSATMHQSGCVSGPSAS
jgi:hypothetical protein